MSADAEGEHALEAVKLRRAEDKAASMSDHESLRIMQARSSELRSHVDAHARVVASASYVHAHVHVHVHAHVHVHVHAGWRRNVGCASAVQLLT